MNAYETIDAYLKEMLDWENSYYAEMRSESFKNNLDNYKLRSREKARIDLEIIVYKYLTSKAIAIIGEAVLQGMAVGRPRIYDQVLSPDVDVIGKTAKVLAMRGDGGMFSPFYLYTLVLEGDDWKIKEVHHSHDKLTWSKAKSL
ncbi:hypothetical protein AAKU61_004609 [Undibacterium sp. GrIS 1.2]|uniref:hypothetical protein n=1 Tax=Undibacterium sp. GrIS 1.2 TaxID=3143933 RepID=UPI003393C129